MVDDQLHEEELESRWEAAPGGGGPVSALLVDLYELTMGQSYFAEGMAERRATFSLFCRRLPRGWGYLLAAGLDDALRYLCGLRFTNDDLAYLETTGLFSSEFLGYLGRLRFTGDVRALPEGTLFFPNEPVLEVTAPVIEAQLAETLVLNQVHFQSLIAGKAARCVDAACGRKLVDFALRRAHGYEAGLKVARSSYLAGFDATSNVLAGREYGIPVAGTMAHSYIECFEDEAAAFRAFTRAYPDGAVLLVDTYGTAEGTARAVAIATELSRAGLRLGGVRIDSGDLLEHGRTARRLLDQAGFPEATVFASGSLDEHEIARLLAADAPIAGFGVGSRLGVAADAPYLDMAYKLVEFDGRPVLKLSEGKATLPAAKQVWRYTRKGRFTHDLVGLAEETPPEKAEPLLATVMTAGRRVHTEPLSTARERANGQRAKLNAETRSLDATPYEVRLSPPLVALRDSAATKAARRHGTHWP